MSSDTKMKDMGRPSGSYALFSMQSLITDRTVGTPPQQPQQVQTTRSAPLVQPLPLRPGHLVASVIRSPAATSDQQASVMPFQQPPTVPVQQHADMTVQQSPAASSQVSPTTQAQPPPAIPNEGRRKRHRTTSDVGKHDSKKLSDQDFRERYDSIWLQKRNEDDSDGSGAGAGAGMVS
jgi:hypothetical protein